MPINSTTVLCFQQPVTVGHRNHSTSQDNSTQVIAVVRARSRSQLWIPYVLIGFGCVAFLAIHFWCYHRRNRERYLRKREEIRVKCGLLERRRITTLMMARSRSEKIDAENNTKKEDEENALLGNSFFSQDDDYFHSQLEENSYYDTLVDANTKPDTTKPYIGCCLTCSVSVPTEIKTSAVEREGNEAFVHKSKSFCNSNLDNLDSRPNQLYSQRLENDMYDFSRPCDWGDGNAIPIQSHYGTDDVETGCTCDGPSASLPDSSTKYKKKNRCYGKTDKRNNYSIISGEDECVLSSVSDDDILHIEDDDVIKIESNLLRDVEYNYNQLPYNCVPNEIQILPHGDTAIDCTGQNAGADKLAQNTSSCLANSKNDSVFSHGNPSHLNKETPRPNVETNAGIMPTNERPDAISNVNSVNNDDKHVDNDYFEDSRVSPMRPIPPDSGDMGEDKQPGLKTPALRSLNPRLVFENLHYNAK